MIPLEFIVIGTPVSHQSKSAARRAAWKNRVGAAASAAAGQEQPVADDVEVRITYFFLGGAPDVDNILKPILDGMCGVVFVDDSQVVDVRSGKRNLKNPIRVFGMSAALAEGFVAQTDFVHVRVVEPGDDTELP